MKTNCWEYMKCGYECKGSDSAKFKRCPALTQSKLDGVHGGKSAGRACWVVTGTLCGGGVQGLFAEKLGRCVMCDFYKLVRSEEEEFYRPSQLIDIVLDNYDRA